MEGPPVLWSVPGPTMCLDGCRFDAALYNVLEEEDEVVVGKVLFLVLFKVVVLERFGVKFLGILPVWFLFIA